MAPLHAAVVNGALPTLPHRLVGQQREYRVVDADVHLDVAVPQLKDMAVLNRRLRRVADASIRSFHQTLRHEASRGPGRYHAMTVGWQLLAQSEKTIGIQLWTAQQHGLTVTIDRAAVWFDLPTATVLSLPDLFAPSAWPPVQRAIAEALSHRYRPAAVRAALNAGGHPKGKSPTFGFASDGGLVVTFAASALSKRAQPVSVRLPRMPLAARLSNAGRSASSAARDQQRTYATRKPVDCAKRKCVALTFDDGPGPFTAELIAMLRQQGAAATFFLVGDRARQAPDLLALINAAGMEVGNHSSHHDELTFLDADDMRRDLQAASQAITSVTGQRPTLLRPPYGSRNPTVDTVAKNLRMAEILWDVDTLDWRYPDPVRVRHAAVTPARRGSIILLHDIHRTTVTAVPHIVEDLRRRGFTLVTVSQLLQESPSPGQVYRRQDVRPHH